MEILTKEDIKEMQEAIETMGRILERMVPERKEVVLRAKEIKQRLGITSQATFQRKTNELINAGMFKDGQWGMMESDLTNYMKTLKNNLQ
jgi:hypothetical protein